MEPVSGVSADYEFSSRGVHDQMTTVADRSVHSTQTEKSFKYGVLHGLQGTFGP